MLVASSQQGTFFFSPSLFLFCFWRPSAAAGRDDCSEAALYGSRLPTCNGSEKKSLRVKSIFDHSSVVRQRMCSARMAGKQLNHDRS
ncbi:hypothetical protein V8C43DRAFT_280151 [Trichoderma afarasin]